MRLRSASRPAPMPRWARPRSSPSSASRAPSSACATCSHAPTARSRSSATAPPCCKPPRGLSPSGRTSRAMTGGNKEDPALVRQMSQPVRLIYARPRTFIALAAGILVALLLPDSHRLVTRLLFGWDALIAVYLVLVYAMMLCNDHQHIRRSAAMQDDGRF